MNPRKVLKSARENLKDVENDSYKNIFIQSDLTPKQRHEAYLKRQERREKKNEKDADNQKKANERMGDLQADTVQNGVVGATGGVGSREGSRSDSFPASQH